MRAPGNARAAPDAAGSVMAQELIRDSPGECIVVLLSAAKDLQLGSAPQLQMRIRYLRSGVSIVI